MTEPEPPLDAGAMYGVLAESTPDAIVSIDAESRILTVNHAAERLFGYPASELVGTSLTTLMPERMRTPHREGMARYLATGERHINWKGTRLPIVTRDGRELTVEVSFAESGSGARRIFVGILRDVTAQVASEVQLVDNAEQLQSQAVELEHQVEEAQAMSEELEQANEELQHSNVALDAARQVAELSSARVHEILESLTDAVSVFDHEWRWTFMNGASRDVLRGVQKDPAAAIGRTLWDEMPELIGTLFETESKRALEENHDVTYEEYFAPLHRWYEVRIVPFSGGVTTFSRDVTERREAAEVLRTREAEFRALANSIPTLAWVAKPDGWIYWYNDRWYSYTGTRPAQMEGWGWQQVHDPVVLPRVLTEWERSIATGQPFEMTFPLRGVDGVFRPFLTRVIPVRDGTGAIVRWFGTNTDIEREHSARQAAEQAASRMSRLQKLTALLASATTVNDVADITVAQVVESSGAATGAFFLRDEATETAVLVRQKGLDDSVMKEYSRIPLSAASPSAESIRTAAAQFIGSRDGSDGLLARFPSLSGVWSRVGREALASVPLVVGGRAAATMTLTFATPQAFGREDRNFFLAIAGQGAQALQRIEAFAAEQRERRRSESIVESITDGFATFDAQMQFTYVNARAATMFGVPREELLGRPITTLARSAESPFVGIIRTVINERKPISIEGFGTIMGRWLDMRAYPAEDGGAIMYFQDITDRRRQQDASSFLADASRLLGSSTDPRQTLLNLAHAAVPRLGDWCAVDLLDDPDSTLVPPAVTRVALVHQDPKKVAQAEAFQREYPPDWSGVRDNATATALRGQSVLMPEITDEMLERGATDARHLELVRALGLTSAMVVPLIAAGRTLGALTLVAGESGRRYDESDLRLAEDLAGRAATAVEHALLLERAEAANVAKTEFLRTMSHELRQPLNAMGGLLELWEMGLRGPLSGMQQADLVRLTRNQQQLTRLIEDLLSFARLEAGRLEVERVRVNVDGLLRALDPLVATDLESAGIAYVCEPCDPAIHVLGDADRVHQILVNLVTNAIRAMPTGGRVTVACEAGAQDPTMVEITVTDTGGGIPADKIQSIFIPFVQLGRALNQPREGAGLGLAISRALAQAMGGMLDVSSTVGQGSTFRLSLPLD